MKRTTAVFTLILVALGSCRGKSQSEAMAGMTGATDTAGGSGREAVHLTAEQAGAIGLTYTVVSRGPLGRTVRTVGQVVPAEPNLADVTTKVDGFVDELVVDATGVAVRRGQPLLTIYSPMLVAAQQELLAAGQLAAAADTSDADAWRNARALLAASRRRLAYWDISPDQIDRLERTGEVTKALTLSAPFDGIVLDKMVVRGQSVMPGMKLYRLADLSTVWVEGEVFEQDLAFMRVGAPARVEVAPYPGRPFTGRVSFVNPSVDEQGRAGRVRVVLPNSGGLLKPGMYATLFVDVRVGADVLSLPAEAVVMTGERNLVFVVGADGVLEPREVVLGPRAGERLQILRGVVEGERVVGSANFLVDAESRLATGSRMAGMPGMENHKP